MAIDHISELPPSQEYVVFLSSLLFYTDSSSERGIEDDSSQRRHNHRIKHLKIRKRLSLNLPRRHKIVKRFRHLNFIDPRHCEVRERCTHTHFGFEVDSSPTLEVICVWEFSETQFRDSTPRHRTILRISLARCIGFQASWFLVNRGVGIVELCGSRLDPTPCLMAIPSTPWQ